MAEPRTPPRAISSPTPTKPASIDRALLGSDLAGLCPAVRRCGLDLPQGTPQATKYKQVVSVALRVTSAVVLLAAAFSVIQFYDSDAAKTIFPILVSVLLLGAALLVIFGEPLKLDSFRKIVDWLTGLVSRLKSSNGVSSSATDHHLESLPSRL